MQEINQEKIYLMWEDSIIYTLELNAMKQNWTIFLLYYNSNKSSTTSNTTGVVPATATAAAAAAN